MSFEKGFDTNRMKGRPIGAKNKSTKLLKELIASFVENNIQKLERDFSSLSTRDKYKILIDFLPYCMSKAQSNEIIYENLSDETIDELINRIYEK